MKMFQCADYDRKTSTNSQKINGLQEAVERTEELGGLYKAAVSAAAAAGGGGF